MTRGPDDESGSVLILLLGLTVICLALVLLVTDASRVYLAKRSLAAQAGADSSLVIRILRAEDARDSTDPALALGARTTDPRVNLIARRAIARIRDPKFLARDSFPAAQPSVVLGLAHEHR